MPLQNTIHGGVTETLDCLLGTHHTSQVASVNDHDSAQNDPMIIASLDLPISHCLVVQKGIKMDQITYVRSHEQVSFSCYIIVH